LKVSAKQVVVWVIIAFLLVAIWKDPAATGASVGDFFRSVGDFLSSLLTKIADFLSNLKG
jgi:hypothetical protein